MVLGAVDGGLGEHPGRLLEGRRGEEAGGVEGRLGDAEQDHLGGGRLAALGQDAVVLGLELEAVDQLGREEVGVARLVDADLAEHLPDDDLDVLVVDRDALAPVDLLDFLHQVALDGVLAAGVEVLLRVDRPVGDRVAGADLLAVLDEELRVVRDRVLALDDVLGPDGEVVALADEDPLLRRHDVGRGAVLARHAGDGLALLDEVAGRREQLGAGRKRERGVVLLALVTLTFVPTSLRMISTMPSMWLISALPLGIRASKSSSTRGRPAVMSVPPATPPVWNVRIVSWVPGSPIDWAAMMPTASPVPTRKPVARLRRSRSGRRRSGPRR